MSERDEAIRLANRLLDKPYIDPDEPECVLARQFLREIERNGWHPMDMAPRDGTLIDVWLGDITEEERQFYCGPKGNRSTQWSFREGKFRPWSGLSTVHPVFIEPTHWRPISEGPK